MGEVYRALDTRLERRVAIKVLPSHLTSASDLRSRFEREAKTISGLQHPNICVLYNVGCQESAQARRAVEAMRELRERLRKEVVAWEGGSTVITRPKTN